jgi:hypothetical protein
MITDGFRWDTILVPAVSGGKQCFSLGFPEESDRFRRFSGVRN